MPFGVNVAGEFAGAPIGELDAWIRPRDLSEVTGVPEESILQKLRDTYQVVKEQKDGLGVRVSSRDQAESLVRQLRNWAEAGGRKSRHNAKDCLLSMRNGEHAQTRNRW